MVQIALFCPSCLKAGSLLFLPFVLKYYCQYKELALLVIVIQVFYDSCNFFALWKCENPTKKLKIFAAVATTSSVRLYGICNLMVFAFWEQMDGGRDFEDGNLLSMEHKKIPRL